MISKRDSHPFPVKHSEIVHESYCKIQLDTLTLDNGDPYTYTMLVFEFEATAVLAMTPDGKLLVGREYRHPTKEWLLSASGGRVNHGEAIEKGAQRELLEETGYYSEHLISLGGIYPFPALSGQKVHFFLAAEAKKVQEPMRDPAEKMETLLLTEDELNEKILAGDPVDGILCTLLHLKRLKQL